MKLSKSERGFSHLLVVALIVLVIGCVSIFVIHSIREAQVKTVESSTTDTSKAKNSSHPGVVKSEVFASSLDKNGAPVKPTSSFSPTTPKIYASLKLNNARVDQKIEYTRYFNGDFVNSGSLTIPKDKSEYATFVFSLNEGKTRKTGTYLVKIYTDGVFEGSSQYTVK